MESLNLKWEALLQVQAQLLQLWIVQEDYLKLVSRFSEHDPDTFFSLFEHVADSRRWSDV